MKQIAIYILFTTVFFCAHAFSAGIDNGEGGTTGNLSNNDWGEGMSFGVAYETLTYRIDSERNSETKNISPQVGIYIAYSWPVITKGLCLDLCQTLYRTSASFSGENGSLTLSPISIGFKLSVANDIKIGWRANNSSWAIDGQGLKDFRRGYGSEYFVEFKQISLEIGYITLNGEAYSSTIRDVQLSNSGGYIKYKFYI